MYRMVVKKSNSSSTYTFQQLNSELNELFNYLKSENYKDEEIRMIFSPLTSKINTKSSIKPKICLTILTLLTFIYFLTYFDTFYWHISAVGRIFLIKILPYFDWTYLKNKRCLIEKFQTSPVKEQIFNCDLCENLNKIDVYDHQDIDEELLRQRYIELDVPVIITKGLENWPKDKYFLDNLIQDETFKHSYPCKLSTNTNKRVDTAARIIEKIKVFDDFFLHFQNCDYDAMKRFRSYTYRPNFLPTIYSPVTYNWLIWNKGYNATNYKTIELVEKLTVIGQLFGATYFRLIPRSDCIEICPVLEIKLVAGEALVFTSTWDLEYRPYEEGENMAVVLETRD